MSTLFPISHIGGLSTLDKDIDTLFNTFFGDGRRISRGATTMTVPRANVSKGEEGYQIQLAVPGYSREDFNIDVQDGTLTISCSNESNVNVENNDMQYTTREYAYTSFNRSWRLPTEANSNAITARYEAGILSVGIPFSEKNANRVVIDVE